MCRKHGIVVLCLAGALLGFASRAQADNTSCLGAILLVPDGSPHDGVFTAANQQRWFKFVVKANRSYAVLVENASPTDEQTTVFISFAPVAGPCNGTPVSVTDTSATEPPSLAPPSVGAQRWSWQASANTVLWFPVFTGATPGSFRIRVVETTLINPRWSTFGGFYTSWGLRNNSNVTVNSTLTILDAAGGVVTTASFAILPGQVVFRDTRPTDLNLSPNQAGSALFTHDGPPGAITADAFLVNENSVPSVVVAAKFEPRTPQH